MLKSYDDLTHKQKRFVDAYDGNASKAAEIAGYKTPGQAGHELLKKPEIKANIANREERSNRRRGHIATRQERQMFWTRVLLGEEKDIRTTTDSEGKKITKETSPKMTDRLKASELLGRSEVDFIEKKELTGDGGKALTIEVKTLIEKLDNA